MDDCEACARSALARSMILAVAESGRLPEVKATKPTASRGLRGDARGAPVAGKPASNATKWSIRARGRKNLLPWPQ
jgi:hypothetical protein